MNDTATLLNLRPTVPGNRRSLNYLPDTVS